jgi:hypothetical protein
MIENVKRTTHISTNIGRSCEHCECGVGAGAAPTQSDGDIATSINHYIDIHGYTLLHVGTETSEGRDGKLWHHTVALLGHDNPPPIRPLPEIAVEQPEPPRAQ